MFQFSLSDGQNPDEDKGFLTAIKVHSHDPPLEFPADRRVRLITEYNATEFHTGVYCWILFTMHCKRLIDFILLTMCCFTLVTAKLS